MTTPINVLFIEANPADACLIQEVLRYANSNTILQLEWADCLKKGLECLGTRRFEAVLLDLNLPDSAGLDTLHQVLLQVPDIPVVVMTGQADEETGMKAMQAGAQDYLVKSEMHGPLLRRVIQYAIQRKQAEHELRESEEKIQNIIQHSNSVFYAHTPQHIITYVSPQARILLDCEPEEAKTRWQTFLSGHPINSEGIASTERAIQTGQRQPPYELELLTLKGRRIWVLVDESPVVKDGKIVSIVGSLTDITERKHTEAALEASEQRLRTWIENSLDMITIVDLHGITQYQSPSVKHLLGYTQEEVLGKPAFELVHPEDRDQMTAHFVETIQNPGTAGSAQCRIRHKDGSWRFMEAMGRIYTDEHGEVVALINSRDITERKKAEAAVAAMQKRFQALIENAPDGIALLGLDGKLRQVTPSTQQILGYTAEDAAGQDPALLTHPDDLPALLNLLNDLIQNPGKVSTIQYRFRHKDGSWRWLESTISNLIAEPGVGAIVFNYRDITDRKQTEKMLQEKERLLSEAQRIGHIGSWSYDIPNDTITFSDEMYRLFDILPAEFHHTSNDFLTLIYSSDRPFTETWLRDVKVGMQSRELNVRVFRKNGELRYLYCTGAVEFDSDSQPTRFIGIAQDVTERKVAEIQINQQIKRLTALSEIDRAITSSFDPHYTLEVILSQVISQLQVDAADILLLNPETELLEYVVGKGFRTSILEGAQFQIGEGHAGRAASEHRMIRISDLKEISSEPRFREFVSTEGFVSYTGVPLIVKGKVKGVLEVYQRSLLQPYQEWLEFFNTLVGQAVIAIENAELFGNLQATNEELYQAYDATIEGWSRAMDLRDRETEGHTQRVTRLTLELARAMGMDESQLVHIRRGALLHDIGKLGVPDHILFKPGQLTPEETELMQKHPEWAYEMLAPIAYLKPALPIPYCHHEKWDGTGYPLGLKGEQIPLEARIFALVDVWDALRSDRPYRKAWSETEVLAYIQGHSGTYFDPRVAELFLKVVKAQGKS